MRTDVTKENCLNYKTIFDIVNSISRHDDFFTGKLFGNDAGGELKH